MELTIFIIVCVGVYYWNSRNKNKASKSIDDVENIDDIIIIDDLL